MNMKLGGTRKVVPTSRLPRLRIQTGTGGCSRRSRRAFPAANGSKSQHEPWRSRPLPNSSAKRPSTTTTTRRRIRSTTGGTGMLPT